MEYSSSHPTLRSRQRANKVSALQYTHIGSCIVFDDLPLEAKQTIAERHVSEVYQCLDDEERESIDSTDLTAWFQDDAERYDNMRIMKTKIDRVVFGHLTDRLLSDLETEDEPA